MHTSYIREREETQTTGDLLHTDGGSSGGGGGHEGCRWNVGEEWSVLILTNGGNRAPAGPDGNREKGTMAKKGGVDIHGE